MGGQVQVMDQAVKAMSDKEGKYLTFFLAGEYGISILKVREIIGMMPITAVPETPEFVQGVINLRGRVIPVVDLTRQSRNQTSFRCFFQSWIRKKSLQPLYCKGVADAVKNILPKLTLIL